MLVWLLVKNVATSELPLGGPPAVQLAASFQLFPGGDANQLALPARTDDAVVAAVVRARQSRHRVMREVGKIIRVESTLKPEGVSGAYKMS